MGLLQGSALVSGYTPGMLCRRWFGSLLLLQAVGEGAPPRDGDGNRIRDSPVLAK